MQLFISHRYSNAWNFTCFICLTCFRHWITNAYACFGFPYFFADVYFMYESYRHSWHVKQSDLQLYQTLLGFVKQNWLMLFHHIGFPIIYLPIIVVSKDAKTHGFCECMLFNSGPWAHGLYVKIQV